MCSMHCPKIGTNFGKHHSICNFEDFVQSRFQEKVFNVLLKTIIGFL